MMMRSWVTIKYVFIIVKKKHFEDIGEISLKFADFLKTDLSELCENMIYEI